MRGQEATFYEFFAGGGMARAGLEWSCLFANDVDLKKCASYASNWGNNELKIADVANVTTRDLPAVADLAWASFPCQDLSLAGSGAGLKGERSATFWLFWRLIRELKKENRSPRLVVLENVCGALTSHGGKDFAAISDAIMDGGYHFGALVIDAVHFVPQSRPRLFIIALREDQVFPPELHCDHPDPLWLTSSLASAFLKLTPQVRAAWKWWRLPDPPQRTTIFADLIEDDPQDVNWHSTEETSRLFEMMSPINRSKVEQAKATGRRMVGCIYKRTRLNGVGKRVQRAEIRFDDVAGCLRTPLGGSSRQSIMLVDGSKVRSRLLSPREAARLMGLPDTYMLPKNYNEAYHIAGDGLVVPVVRYLAANLLEPLLGIAKQKDRQAA